MTISYGDSIPGAELYPTLSNANVLSKELALTFLEYFSKLGFAPGNPVAITSGALPYD